MVDERVLNFRKQSVYAEPDSEGTKKKNSYSFSIVIMAIYGMYT